jgi:hypothetical protein
MQARNYSAEPKRTPSLFLDIENYVLNYFAGDAPEADKLTLVMDFIELLKPMRDYINCERAYHQRPLQLTPCFSGLLLRAMTLSDLQENNEPITDDIFTTYVKELNELDGKLEAQHLIDNNINLNNCYINLHLYMQAVNQFDTDSKKKQRKYDDFCLITSSSQEIRDQVMRKYMKSSKLKVQAAPLSRSLAHHLSLFPEIRDAHSYVGHFANLMRDFYFKYEESLEDEAEIINPMREEYIAMLEKQRAVSIFANNVLQMLASEELGLKQSITPRNSRQ